MHMHGRLTCVLMQMHAYSYLPSHQHRLPQWAMHMHVPAVPSASTPTGPLQHTRGLEVPPPKQVRLEAQLGAQLDLDLEDHLDLGGDLDLEADLHRPSAAHASAGWKVP